MSTRDNLVQRMDMLERRATVVRSRLLRTVDALDARRHQIVGIGAKAKNVVVPTVLAALAIVALLGVTAVSIRLGLARRHPIAHRFALAIRDVERARRPSLARRVLEKVTMTLVSALAGEIAKRASRRLVTRPIAREVPAVRVAPASSFPVATVHG